MHFTMGLETILGIKKINFIIKYEKKAYLLMFDSCVYHVISAGRQILKLALNVEIFISFFVCCWIKKKGESQCKFCNEINHTTFFLSLRCSKLHFTTTLKNTTTKINRYSLSISTFNDLSK